MIRFLSEKPIRILITSSHCIFSGANNKWLQTLEALIKSETLFDDYMLKLVESKLYLWWGNNTYPRLLIINKHEYLSSIQL